MAILYAPDDFQKAQMIVNTSGWDTDCNAGNVGCLMGIMLGLQGLETGPDWRGPVADRLLISSADGGNAINDAVRMAYYISNLGLRLQDLPPIAPPKDGAQFHFSLPGSLQGFRPQGGFDANKSVAVSNALIDGRRMLEISYSALGPGQYAAATTPSFSPREVLEMRTYNLMATPLIYPGQVVRAGVLAPAENSATIEVCIRLRPYNGADELVDIDSPALKLKPGEKGIVEWIVPEVDAQPIAEIGIAITTKEKRADGRLLIDYLRWEGTPTLALRRPSEGGDFWRLAWINGVDSFSTFFSTSFRLSQSTGEGIIAHGTREWRDYNVKTEFVIHMGNHGGVALRVQGRRRYYAIRVTATNRVEIVRVRDAETKVLASAPFTFALERSVAVEACLCNTKISATLNDVTIEAIDGSEEALTCGGIGLLIHEGALSADYLKISGVKSFM